MKIFLVLFVLLLYGPTVHAADLGPESRLMLAAIIAEHSPEMSALHKQEIARFAQGNLEPDAQDYKVVTVAADDVECRVSDVDITSRSCELRYGSHVVTLRGRAAHELFATIEELGVVPSGAAGSFFIGVSGLKCTIGPAELRQKDGGGAACSFGAGRQ